ncbi:hypothetical protein FRC01_013405 [Tulasnella sp. 417]|nr:hypothetical protein FRC01_013405 [Tulasnella sp. 417]
MATLSTPSEAQSIKDIPASGTLTPATEPTLHGDPPIESERVPATAEADKQPQWSFVQTSVSTALPTIVQDLQGTEFASVGSAFALGSTAILPLTGGLAQIFGRRPVVLGSLILFALGSGLGGGATNMNMLIAGRVADLVPLSERGVYLGLIGSVWAIAAAIGPSIGGAFSQTNWRWLFYTKILLTAIAIVFVWFFLRLKTPQDDFRTKAGVKYPWSSYQVLVPLIPGLLLTAAFFVAAGGVNGIPFSEGLVYEAKFAIEPVVPWELVNNRTALSGYVGVFLHSIVSTAVIYYLPVYFQTSLLQSPVRSGVSIFGNSFTIPPSAIAHGVTVTLFKLYLPQNYLGWVLTAISVGLLSTLKVNSPVGAWVGYQIIEGISFGILYGAPQFPVLASVNITESAHALALFVFVRVRSYSQTWGVTLGGTILQNELKKKLPQAFLDMFPGEGVEITYAAIPRIGGLAEPLKGQVRDAFAGSLRTVWIAMAAVSVVGFFTVLGMKQLEMHEVTDENWGLEEQKKVADEEKDGKTPTH